MNERALKRFEKKYIPEPNSDCWIWIACIDKNAYGRFNDGTGHNTRSASVISYEHLNGPAPKGFHIDHLCRVHCCVNPNHLEAVPARINLLRGIGFPAIHASRTHCPNGHAYEGNNCILEVDRGYIHRRCRICKNMRQFARNRRIRKGEHNVTYRSRADQYRTDPGLR